MARMHAPELEDEAWFPRPLRDGATGFLQNAVETFHLFDVAGPVLLDVMKRTRAPGIVDLCSGGGGPLLSILSKYEKAGLRIPAVLTDLYPNLDAFERAKHRSGGLVQGITESVDATNVPANLRGVRTLFNAFHHFRPDDARRMLVDAAQKMQPFCSFEFVERRAATMAFIAGTPLAALALAPFARPAKPAHLLLTYALPLIPGVVLWDGMASCLRAYSTPELRQLCDAAETPKYHFRIERLAVPRWPGRITCLIGEPEMGIPPPPPPPPQRRPG